MDWEELKKKAEELGYYELYDDGDVSYFNGDGSYLLINRDMKYEVHFYKDGVIENGWGDIIAEDRTYEQMYQIMLALQ